MTRITPVGNHVFVIPDVPPTTTPGGLHLPGAVTMVGPTWGKVVATGPGELLPNGSRTPIEVRDGDRVLYHVYQEEVKIDDVTYHVLDAADILAAEEAG